MPGQRQAACLNTLPLDSRKTMNKTDTGPALRMLTVEKSRCRAAGAERRQTG